MVDGVQSRSFAQAAAATLKLLRSAHRRTLPAKNTATVTGQLIGRAAARSVAVDAASVVVGMAFGIALSPGRLKRNNFSLNRYFALGCYLSMIFSENRYPLFGIML
jgi:hypothetical protein